MSAPTEQDVERAWWILRKEAITGTAADSLLNTIAAALQAERERTRAEEREACAMIAQDFGTAAYKENQKQFTSKDRKHLRVMQDVADDITKAIRVR